MDVLCGLLSCPLWAPMCMSLRIRYNYIRRLDEYKKNLQNELARLKSRGNDIKEELSRGWQQHGRKPKQEVNDWLEKWEKFVKDIESVHTEYGNGMCLRGLCPNCYSRLKQSKRIEKLINDVKGLLENGQFSDGLFAASLPGRLPSLPAPVIHGSTAERKRVEILQCITDPEVHKIGVYGMGGIGKTTIMTNIYNQLKRSPDFDIVIMVTVSKSPNLENLQDMIAQELLGFKLPETSSVVERANMLYAAFARRGNFLIIFDDIWDKVSPEDVGIPEPTRKNGSKIVWTTRTMKVCNSMESQREIKVESLLEEEAWTLFKDKVGGEDVISPEIEPIAKEVAEECGGLPLALITVGRALRRTKQLEVWRSALQELRSSSTDQIEDMEEEVFRRLKFSYDRLRNDKVRECFLYCALYPEDHDIRADGLIEYWMAEGLIVEDGHWGREKDNGYAILKELKDACMIESAGEYCVKMHDVIRDLAIIITRKQPHFMVKARLRLRELPEEEEWKESLERVSLMNNNIETLHGQPNCPRLLTLFLQNNYYLNSISNTFFKDMHNLRVLNLSEAKIESLPDAFSDLTNLHALLLQRCEKLKCLPSLANLHKLRVLDLIGVPLEEVPHGLENLLKLRYLDISGGRGLRSFRSGILSKCTKLEHLLMRDSGWRWPCSNENDDDKDKATVAEIISLEKLTMLSAEFSDVTSFNIYYESGNWNRLKKSNFGIGGVGPKSFKHHMCLGDCDFRNLSGVMLPSITRSLIIIECKAMEWIEEGGKIGFPDLHELVLCHLPSFQGLCKVIAQQEALRNLGVLKISDCHQLKWLIPIDLLQNNLHQLRIIDVKRCDGMEEIISCKTGLATICLPKLQSLSMINLPRLTSVFLGKLVCNFLYFIHLAQCPNMRKLPFSIDKVPSLLNNIIGTEEWWKSLEWDDPQLEKEFQPKVKYIKEGEEYRVPFL